MTGHVLLVQGRVGPAKGREQVDGEEVDRPTYAQPHVFK